jgi:hypothetical protein
MANKGQTDRIYNLFNKVYGYQEGLDRIAEQTKRYHEKNKHLKQPKSKEKNFLTKLFDTEKFISDKDMLERYQNHLNKTLISSHLGFVQQRYKLFERADEGGQVKELDFYERMQIDNMIRDNEGKGQISPSPSGLNIDLKTMSKE